MRRGTRTGRAVAVLALLVAAGSSLALAGGNTAVRNPSDLSQVIERKWDDRMLPIHWVLSADGLPGSGISNATLAAQVGAAFDTWEALPTSKLDWTYDGEVPIHSTGLGGPLSPGVDGRNLVTFTDPDLIFPPGVLAVALTFSFTQPTTIDAGNADLDDDGDADIPLGVYPAGTIFDGDIAFNSSESWSTSGTNGSIDIQAVALHEVGHAFGLSHSMVRDVVMWPFLAYDIAAARLPSADDVAYASYFYPQQPAYGAAFGSISGQVTNGFTTGAVLGAHVYAADPATGAVVTGAYSGDDGSYVIPGLPSGNYLVGIEPLDGDPLGLDPHRVNSVIQFTLDTNFPEEYYDANEAAVEADPNAAVNVAVTAGADSNGVDVVTNTLVVPGVNVIFEPGYNLFAYPVQVPTGLGAFDLLQAIGDDSEVTAIERYDRDAATFVRAEYVDDVPSGVDFPIERGEGYVVYMVVQKVVSFAGGSDCPELDLRRGLNLVGIACPPPGYTAFQLLEHVGERFETSRIENWDTDTAQFEQAEYDTNDTPVGTDFNVANGRGYIVQMLADKSSLRIPPPGEAFAPVISGLTPGRGVPGQIVVILGAGFKPDVAANTVTFNGVGASVVFATSTSLTTVVPASASTGLVRVSVAGLQSNAVNFIVEPTGIAEDPVGPTPIVSGQTGNGNLASDGEQDRYIFTALAGSLVTIDAMSTNPGVPDLVVLLEDPYGVIVATDDNGGSGTNAKINNFELATTGTHTIVVSNVPGSGLGPYGVRLTVTSRATAPQVSILGGNYQTSLAGSTLPVPLSVFVTGVTGSPVSNAAVTFVATDTTFGMTNPAYAGSTVVNTNESGIVQVSATLPGANGQYSITVTVDGVPTTETFVVAASNKFVATVETNNQVQTGTVDQFLPNPLQVVVKDNLGEFVGGALIAFRVVSGGGSLGGPACLGRPGAICSFTPEATGMGQATFKIGKKIDVPHIVAAFVPGMTEPLLFEGLPKAAAPASLHSNRTHFNRMTLGTSALNAMQIQVFDQFDNPVEGATVSYTPSGGLSVAPGLGPGGQVFTDFKTNEDGLHVARLTAIVGSVDPTINEFGDEVSGVYNVTAQVGGGPSESFAVHVDMGPSMVTWSGQNISHIYGQPLPTPVEKLVLRWQRRDTFIDNNEDGEDDDDNGDFRDEDFHPLDGFGVEDVTINLEAKREDGRDEADHSLEPMTLSATTATTDGGGVGSVDVTTMGDVGGVKKVIGRIDGIFVEWLFDDGTVLDSKTFTDENDFAESTNLIAVPVTITVDLDDAHSGIDLSTFVASLNGTPFFDAASPPAVFPDFPEAMELMVGGASLPGIDGGMVQDSKFTALSLVWQPAAPKLSGSNTVLIQKVKDKAENEQSDTTSTTFSYP